MTDTVIVWRDEDCAGNLLVFRAETECLSRGDPIRLPVETADQFIQLTQQVLEMGRAISDLPSAWEDSV